MHIRKHANNVYKKMIDLSLSFDVLDADEKAISRFCKYCERDVVWAASCERSYEGMRSRQMLESTV